MFCCLFMIHNFDGMTLVVATHMGSCHMYSAVSLCRCAKTWSEWLHLYFPVNKQYNANHEREQLWTLWVYPEVEEIWVCARIFAYALWKLILGICTYRILQAIHITTSFIHLGFQVRSLTVQFRLWANYPTRFMWSEQCFLTLHLRIFVGFFQYATNNS